MSSHTRIAVVGDTGVGKSSLIIACSSNIVRASQQDALQKLPETKISLRGGHAGVCIDTSAVDIEETKLSVRSADVVIICFALDDPRSMESALTFWLPDVTKENRDAPVIMVACKEDVQQLTEEQRAVRFACGHRWRPLILMQPACHALHYWKYSHQQQLMKQ